MARSLLDELNPQQREAVTHGDGPLLVIAGAGTGKTKTLAFRVAQLIARGVPAEQLLLLTFTRRAAQEMLARAQAASRHSTGKVWGGTFHAVANRLLRGYGAAVKLSPDFTVMDEADAQDLLGLVRTELGLVSRDQRFPRKATLLAIYSRVVNSREPLPQVLAREYPWCVEAESGLRQVFTRYTQRKHERQVLDYDDLLLFWHAVLEDGAVARAMSDQFAHILVDEYQDTNIVQAEILARLRATNHNITVVGDDAQSIYSFRGATVRNILDFPAQFPDTTVVTLEENYRSVQPILDLGNAVMAGARYRFTKHLWSSRPSAQKPRLVTCFDEPEQCRYVCDRILAHYEEGIPLHEQAVLFRAGHHSDQLEVELTRRRIPFHKYGGLRFIEAAHVKDLLAFLRILENPRDDLSWFRILDMLDGIGPRAAERVMTHLAGHGFTLETLAECPVPPAAHEPYRELVRLLVPLATTRLGVATQIERVRRYYDPLLERLYDNPLPRRRDLEQLEQIAGRYKSRASFISDLTLDPPRSTADLAGPPRKDEDFLILSTMHSAKGCEWRVVYIIHAADGMIPSDMALADEAGLEEERRLFYVAITRARDQLYAVFPLRYYFTRHVLGDGHAYAQLTRFLPADVLPLVERVSGAPPDAERPAAPPTEVDIRDRIAEYWNRPDE